MSAAFVLAIEGGSLPRLPKMNRIVLRILRRPSAADCKMPVDILTSFVYVAEAAQKRRASAPSAGSLALSCAIVSDSTDVKGRVLGNSLCPH